MASNWTEDDLKAFETKRAQKKTAPRKPEKPAGKERLQALGRLKTGTMNKTEERYAQRLKLLQHSGKLLWWKFEGIRLILAPGCTLTVDFAIMTDTGVIELHDVKGSKAIFSEDARAKMKVAAEMFPFVIRAVYPKPKSDDWLVEDF